MKFSLSLVTFVQLNWVYWHNVLLNKETTCMLLSILFLSPEHNIEVCFFAQIKISSQSYDSQWNILYCEITNMGFIMINFLMCPMCFVSLGCILLLEKCGYQPTHPWLTVSNIYMIFTNIHLVQLVPYFHIILILYTSWWVFNLFFMICISLWPHLLLTLTFA